MEAVHFRCHGADIAKLPNKRLLSRLHCTCRGVAWTQQSRMSTSQGKCSANIHTPLNRWSESQLTNFRCCVQAAACAMLDQVRPFRALLKATVRQDKTCTDVRKRHNLPIASAFDLGCISNTDSSTLCVDSALNLCQLAWVSWSLPHAKI